MIREISKLEALSIHGGTDPYYEAIDNFDFSTGFESLDLSLDGISPPPDEATALDNFESEFMDFNTSGAESWVAGDFAGEFWAATAFLSFDSGFGVSSADLFLGEMQSAAQFSASTALDDAFMSAVTRIDDVVFDGGAQLLADGQTFSGAAHAIWGFANLAVDTVQSLAQGLTYYVAEILDDPQAHPEVYQYLINAEIMRHGTYP